MQALTDERSIVIKKADEGSTVMPMYTRMFRLMKRFCRNLWEQVISLFKASDLKGKLVINNLNTLRISIKKFLIFYPTFIGGYILFLGDL